ncbi:MAG: hypothetical protein K8R87_07395 [Verrucomicrobia bacterium]|nr:hypothetical protein [Verrucomicrobiota bacterium]
MTVHDLPPLVNPVLFVGGPMHGDELSISTERNQVTAKPETWPHPPGHNLPGFDYTRRLAQTIIGSTVTIFVLKELSNDEVNILLMTKTRYAVAFGAQIPSWA